MKKKRLVVGVTGSFGSGKTTIARIFKQLGAADVIDSDTLAHEVFRPGHPIGRKIKTLFHIQGKLNRKEIADEVFSNPAKRRQLEALVHPYVFEKIRERLKKVKKGIVVLEIPLLFETDFHRLCDVTISVFTPEGEIKKRLSQKGFGASEIQARWKAQLSAARKKRRADLWIGNQGTKKALIQKTKTVWKKFKLHFN